MNWLSLKHRKIGRAGADQHGSQAFQDALRYACRPGAASRVETQHAPDAEPGEVSALIDWSRSYEEAVTARRANARIADILIVSLPRDTNRDERHELCSRIAGRLTDGRCPSVFALHDKGQKDASNPHAHMIICDRDESTGRRVFGFSSRGSTRRARHEIAGVINDWYRETGRGDRIDPRSFRERGLDREPTIHEGPGSRKLAERGEEPESGVRVVGRRNGKRGMREIDYRDIDGARDGAEVSRMRANEVIRELNAERDRRRRAEKAYQKAAALLGRAARFLGIRKQRVGLSELEEHVAGLEKKHGRGSGQHSAEQGDRRDIGTPDRPENDNALEAELQDIMGRMDHGPSRGNGHGQRQRVRGE
jgi:hypothetical protein